MKTVLSVLKISNPEIALHVIRIMLYVFGIAAVFGFIAGLPLWTRPFSVLVLAITFYSGYHFEINYRTRRFEEFRYERKSS